MANSSASERLIDGFLGINEAAWQSETTRANGLCRKERGLPGDGKPDWWIVSEVGKRMGFQQAFDYPTEAHIFQEYVAMSTKCPILTKRTKIQLLRD